MPKTQEVITDRVSALATDFHSEKTIEAKIKRLSPNKHTLRLFEQEPLILVEVLEAWIMYANDAVAEILDAPCVPDEEPPQLSNKQRKVAEVILEHPGENAAWIATKAHISEPSVSRRIIPELKKNHKLIGPGKGKGTGYRFTEGHKLPDPNFPWQPEEPSPRSFDPIPPYLTLLIVRWCDIHLKIDPKPLQSLDEHLLTIKYPSSKEHDSTQPGGYRIAWKVQPSPDEVAAARQDSATIIERMIYFALTLESELRLAD
ncbi:MAG: hypothetical protein IH984_09560 [Planctomycetes bacterium]|nr:hypothetical protein [Planctomycetota bacterium]